jgi:hypothetical protein
MGRVSHPPLPDRLVPVAESVEILYLSPSEVATEVNKLQAPWIGDEGPLAAEFWQHPGGAPKRPLYHRGLAFDDQATVTWDEDVVQVIRPAPPAGDVIARRSKVLIRFPLLEFVYRIDYLSQGVLLASRFQPGPRGGTTHA